MKQNSVSISFDADKLNATKRYMKKKNTDLEEELTAQLMHLYEKHVPSSVREYIDENVLSEMDISNSVRRSVQREVDS